MPHAFVALDLWSKNLWVNTGGQEIKQTPPLVGLGWVMRWPIPPLRTEAMDELLTSLTPHAEALCARVEIVRGPVEGGVRLLAGAGTSLDAIQWKCAEMWRGRL